MFFERGCRLSVVSYGATARNPPLGQSGLYGLYSGRGEANNVEDERPVVSSYLLRRTVHDTRTAVRSFSKRCFLCVLSRGVAMLMRGWDTQHEGKY